MKNLGFAARNRVASHFFDIEYIKRDKGSYSDWLVPF